MLRGSQREWASDARQHDRPGFSDAPHRTRRAPFVTHRVLHRCLRIAWTALFPEEVRPDAKRSQRCVNHTSVTPAKGSSSGLMPAVLLREVPHASFHWQPLTVDALYRYSSAALICSACGRVINSLKRNGRQFCWPIPQASIGAFALT
jgi:hypothetical protein